MESPICCKQKTKFIGVTEGGGDKFHCSVCYKIQIVNRSKEKKGG
jgi:hypothetical protein